MTAIANGFISAKDGIANRITALTPAQKERIWAFITTAALLTIMFAFVVFADDKPADGGGADDTAWNAIIGVLDKWLGRLGVVMIAVGLVRFGMGWQRDDADSKSQGLAAVIGGAIVMGVMPVVNTILGS